MEHYDPLYEADLEILGIADRIKLKPHLKFLYPDKPVQSTFEAHFTNANPGTVYGNFAEL